MPIFFTCVLKLPMQYLERFIRLLDACLQLRIGIGYWLFTPMSKHSCMFCHSSGRQIQFRFQFKKKQNHLKQFYLSCSSLHKMLLFLLFVPKICLAIVLKYYFLYVDSTNQRTPLHAPRANPKLSRKTSISKSFFRVKLNYSSYSVGGL